MEKEVNLIQNIILFSFLSFSIFLALHLIIWRIKEGYRGIGLILLTSTVAYFLVCTLYLSWLKISVVSHLWTTAPLYFCLIMIYSHFYAGILRSVSIRIIQEIRESPNNSMTIKEINKVYSVDEMVRTRLSLLEENGWLSKSGEDYSCLKKALRTVKINLYLHKIFRLDNSG